MIDASVAEKQVDNSSDPTLPAGEALPARIGRYTIERKLGEGGMGVVYAARDDRLERTVALKTLSRSGQRRDRAPAALARGPGRRQRQPPERLPDLRNRRRRRRAVHRHGAARGRGAGRSASAGPLSVARAIPIGLGILAALSALHARGIVHRDLKPSNVFLTAARREAARLRPGAAGARGDRSQPTTGLTRSGMVMGTPRYMAPEQVTGEPVDARSDLFAAGAILFEMLAGRPGVWRQHDCRGPARHAATSSRRR